MSIHLNICLPAPYFISGFHQPTLTYTISGKSVLIPKTNIRQSHKVHFKDEFHRKRMKYVFMVSISRIDLRYPKQEYSPMCISKVLSFFGFLSKLQLHGTRFIHVRRNAGRVVLLMTHVEQWTFSIICKCWLQTTLKLIRLTKVWTSWGYSSPYATQQPRFSWYIIRVGSRRQYLGKDTYFPRDFGIGLVHNIVKIRDQGETFGGFEKGCSSYTLYINFFHRSAG